MLGWRRDDLTVVGGAWIPRILTFTEDFYLGHVAVEATLLGVARLMLALSSTEPSSYTLPLAIHQLDDDPSVWNLGAVSGIDKDAF